MNCFVYGLFLSSLFVTAYGLECYQCQKLMDGKYCNDPFEYSSATEGFLGDCDDDHFCVKYKTVVKLRDSGYINGWERHSVVVSRACEPKLGKSEGCTGWQNNGGITIKCWCGSDGCNSGRVLVPSRTVAIVSFLAVVLALARRWL